MFIVTCRTFVSLLVRSEATSLLTKGNRIQLVNYRQYAPDGAQKLNAAF